MGGLFLLTHDSVVPSIPAEVLLETRLCSLVLLSGSGIFGGDFFSKTPQATNFMAVNPESFDGTHFVSILRKWFTRDIFGLHKYLAPGMDIYSHPISNRHDKTEALEQFQRFVASFDSAGSTSFKTLGELTAVAMNELVMNAVFHGTPRYRGANKTLGFELDPSEEVVVSWGFDGHRLGFSVTDRSGTLEKKTVVEHLKSSLGRRKNGSAAVSAGIGLQFIFCRMNHLVVNVDPGSKTEVMGIVLPLSSRLATERNGHSFHYFHI